MAPKSNIGSIDRFLRTVIGLGLIAGAVTGTADPWGYIGAVPLVTALIGWCPAYRLVGLSTCGR